MELQTPARRVQRVRHELKVRELTVARVESPSPNFVSITFVGESLWDFVSDSFDDHVKFMLEDGSGEPVRRDYTPRSFDRRKGELTLEFALHGHGAASDWARQARVGQTAHVGGPRGSMIVPLDYDWHLLVGDATALPAIARRLEELPTGTRAEVFVHLDDPADQRELPSAAEVRVHWYASADALLDAVRGWAAPAGEGFAWCAGEAASMATLRQVLLQDKGLPKEAARIAVYWKQGASDFHERLEG
ncbi:siderophore-interacting protein [Hylemonella gracilis]|uniref:Siderophore-interacting protein n=1 Tax=Hylemonella gracilis TaxID=80880 RepID=A0A4P6UL86_9BURK|nr:siderophore-interacting protein [Hylemonella gracilis]QBK04827.1 siderophore-interacting protein [Hylemonella gracilis]